MAVEVEKKCRSRGGEGIIISPDGQIYVSCDEVRCGRRATGEFIFRGSFFSTQPIKY
jgi:hypothetical protein